MEWQHWPVDADLTPDVFMQYQQLLHSIRVELRKQRQCNSTQRSQTCSICTQGMFQAYDPSERVGKHLVHLGDLCSNTVVDGLFANLNDQSTEDFRVDFGRDFEFLALRVL